jgi:hypothetical protein
MSACRRHRLLLGFDTISALTSTGGPRRHRHFSEMVLISPDDRRARQLILELLGQMRAELGDVRSDISQLRSELRSDFATKSDLHTLRADVAADLLSTRKELSEQIVGLRRAVIEYHTSVIGHGVLISELEARVRRVEQHLNLPSLHPT